MRQHARSADCRRLNCIGEPGDALDGVIGNHHSKFGTIGGQGNSPGEVRHRSGDDRMIAARRLLIQLTHTPRGELRDAGSHQAFFNLFWRHIHVLDRLARQARKNTRNLFVCNRSRARNIVNGLTCGVEQRGSGRSRAVFASHIRAAPRLRCGNQLSGLERKMRKSEDDLRVQIIPQDCPISPVSKSATSVQK